MAVSVAIDEQFLSICYEALITDYSSLAS